MRARVAEFTRRGAETLNTAIVGRALRHTGHPALRRHVLNARHSSEQVGCVVRQGAPRESARKVDALAAAVLARIARGDVLAGPQGKPERSGEVWAL